MGRLFMIGSSLTATLLFIFNYELVETQHWSAVLIPMVLIILVVVNYLRFTRFVAWVIFSLSFFSFLVLLSAFTLRWRLESGFDAAPFYRTIIMHVAFIYVSLAQIKLLGSPITLENPPEEKNED